MRKKKIQILLSAAAFLFLMGGTMPSVAQERKIGRVERRADRNFIRQKFDKAMAQYETAIRREKDEAGQAALHLKTARLYFMVREYGRASEHYDKAMSLRPDLLGVDDVCDYVMLCVFRDKPAKQKPFAWIMPIKTYIAAISAIRIHWRHLPCAIRFRKIPGFRQNAYY